MQGETEFHKCIFLLSEHYKSNTFPKHGGIGFILEVNSLEVSNVVSCSVSLMLTLSWGIDISLEKLTPETGGLNLKNTLCTLHL